MTFLKPSEYLPTQKEFITDRYIDTLLSTGRWSPHGSDLLHYIDDYKLEDDFPSELLTINDTTHILKHPAFRNYLEAWLPHRYKHVSQLLDEEINAFPKTIYRSMWVDEELKANIIEGRTQDVGIYWGTGYTEAWNVDPTLVKGKTEITLTATITPDNIDWSETLRSRMDYVNGDQECEVQLLKEARPQIQKVFYHDSGQQFEIADQPELKEQTDDHLAFELGY